eukprot:6205866-Pleurochrysis_carterae.AAC.1
MTRACELASTILHKECRETTAGPAPTPLLRLYFCHTIKIINADAKAFATRTPATRDADLAEMHILHKRVHFWLTCMCADTRTLRPPLASNIPVSVATTIEEITHITRFEPPRPMRSQPPRRMLLRTIVNTSTLSTTLGTAFTFTPGTAIPAHLLAHHFQHRIGNHHYRWRCANHQHRHHHYQQSLASAPAL